MKTFEQEVTQVLKTLKEGTTYPELVELTGIEQTRLFRMINGAPIKLGEIQKLIDADLLCVVVVDPESSEARRLKTDQISYRLKELEEEALDLVLKDVREVPYEEIEKEFGKLSGLDVDDEDTNFRAGCADYVDSDYVWRRKLNGDEVYYIRWAYEQAKKRA